jgi:hypothetical protein
MNTNTAWYLAEQNEGKGWIYETEQARNPLAILDVEHARRIVACVNACAGIADPERAVRLLRDLSRVLDSAGEDDEVSGADALDALTDLRDRARAVLGGAA